MNHGPRILVTGASGYIGRHALPELVQQGWEVHALTSRGATTVLPGVAWHRADMLRPMQARAVLHDVQPSHLLHLAWDTTPGVYWQSPQNLRWVEASLQLLEAFRDCGGQRAILAGTAAEYDWHAGICREQSGAMRPQGVYGQCKLALSLLAAAVAKTSGLSLAWPRIFFMYGPGGHPERFPTPIIRALRRNLPAPCSHGQQWRDVTHVADVASALTKLVGSTLEGPINIGSGHAIQLGQMVQIIAERLQRPDLVRWGAIASPADESELVVADVTRLRDELGWQPQIDLTEGLRAMIDSRLEEQLHAA